MAELELFEDSGWLTVKEKNFGLRCRQLEHGVVAAEAVGEVPVCFLLQGATGFSRYPVLVAHRQAEHEPRSIEQLLGRRYSYGIREGHYFLPANDEAVGWALDWMLAHRVESHVAGTRRQANLLAIHAAESDRVDFALLRAAYKHVHGTTLRSYNQWFDEPADRQRATAYALFELLAGDGAPHKAAVQWLSELGCFKPLQQLERFLRGCVSHRLNPRERLFFPVAPERMVLMFSVGQRAILLQRTRELWDALVIEGGGDRAQAHTPLLVVGSLGGRQRLDAHQASSWLAGCVREEQQTQIKLLFHRPASPDRRSMPELRLDFGRLAQLEEQLSTYAPQSTDGNGVRQQHYALETKTALQDRARQLKIKGFTKLDVDELRHEIAERAIDRQRLAERHRFGFFLEPWLGVYGLPQQVVDDPADLEALICQSLDERLFNPALAAQPSRLRARHSFLSAYRPLSPFLN